MLSGRRVLPSRGVGMETPFPLSLSVLVGLSLPGRRGRLRVGGTWYGNMDIRNKTLVNLLIPSVVNTSSPRFGM